MNLQCPRTLDSIEYDNYNLRWLIKSFPVSHIFVISIFADESCHFTIKDFVLLVPLV